MKLSDFPKVEELRKKLEGLRADLAAAQPDDVYRIVLHRKGYAISDHRISIGSSGYDDETSAFLDALVVIREFIQSRVDKTVVELTALGVTVDD